MALYAPGFHQACWMTPTQLLSYTLENFLHFVVRLRRNVFGGLWIFSFTGKFCSIFAPCVCTSCFHIDLIRRQNYEVGTWYRTCFDFLGIGEILGRVGEVRFGVVEEGFLEKGKGGS